MGKPGRAVIIGAGPTGLGAAWRLKARGVRDWTVLEASGRVGGLASSRVDERGFTWDLGGHVQFSHYDAFDEVMSAALPDDEWLFHERESWVWVRGRFVPYPFQYNIRRLPPADLERCVKGLEEVLAKPPARPPANFAEWVQASFGRGIGEVFMVPYNRKVWAYPLEELSYGWIGDRVAVVDLKRVKENISLGRDDASWGPNNRFRFPKRGGTGRIWERVADLVGRERIRLNAPVARVLPASKEVVLTDGSRVPYDVLLNTSPLDDFASRVHGLPTEAAESAKRLLRSATHIIGFGLRGRPSADLATKCWMYFPEDDCPFYRVTVFSNYSSNNVPDIATQWSLMAEVSESPKKPVDASRVVEDCLRGLLATRLIESRETVLGAWHQRLERGYPTPSVGRDALLDAALPALEALGIQSRGRFGAWKYEASNQDHSFMQGWEWADRMVDGSPELTFTEPHKANAGAGRAKR